MQKAYHEKVVWGLFREQMIIPTNDFSGQDKNRNEAINDVMSKLRQHW